jgi:transcriptional regulator with XRE-family HTH domain
LNVRDIGERVYWLRDERGWTQEDLARKAGVSPTTISHIESGTIERPRVNTIRRLARGFGVSTEDLTNPKASSPSAPSPEEAGGAEDELKERVELLQEYGTRLQDVAERLRRDLNLLQAAQDSEGLSTLQMNVVWTLVGADKSIDEDEDLEESEDETMEELEARGAMWEAYGRLSDLYTDIDDAIDALEQLEERPADVPYLPDRIRRKAG